MAGVPSPVFMANDIGLRWHDALQAVRSSGAAVIVDTDGSRFSMTSSGAAGRAAYAVKGFQNALRILRLVELPEESRDPVIYGEFGWIAVLSVDSQTVFAWSYVEAIEGIPDVGVEPVEELLYDWQQTARAFGDPRLRARLTSDVLVSPAD